jgi:hypothetical protein
MSKDMSSTARRLLPVVEIDSWLNAIPFVLICLSSSGPCPGVCVAQAPNLACDLTY